jgi:TolB protein
MKINSLIKHLLYSGTLFGMSVCLLAQAQIDVTKQTMKPGAEPPTWVSLSGFTGEAESVLRFDLYVQGFNFTNSDNAQYEISGGNSGNLQGRVIDRFQKRTLLSKAYSGASLRRQTHLFVDEFVTAIGRKGIAQTKIAFKADTGANSEIYVSDFDGSGAQAVTADRTIVAAPTWMPGRLALYYTSYKLGNPDIFFHDLSSGQRHVFSRYSGLNSSAAVSPDGRRVAMILSKGGSPDVYACNADGTGLLRLTATREDESSPCWSANGEWICYATKVNERRVLCKVPASGGQAQRIPTSGVLNPSEPDWSPDGKWIAFTAQMGTFEICVVPAGGGAVTELVAGEDPSWSPNSRTLVFTRREGGGRRVLSLLDVPTKQYKDVSRITGSGNDSQPSWAK